jgi:hypothetical protein
MAKSRRDLTLTGGMRIWLQKDTGVVQSVKDWSETHVRSSGGGGHLSGGTGHVSAPIISSSTIHRQVFFVKCEDGTEMECDTNLINIGVGHQVTLVWGAKQGKDYGPYLGFYNHTTNRDAVHCDSFGQRRLGCLLSFAYILFFCCILYSCLDSAAHNSNAAATSKWVQLIWIWFLVSTALAVFLFIRRRRFKRFYKDLTLRVRVFMREG